MLQTLSSYFSSTQFMPHGHCFLWRPDILWTMVASDLVITLAYYMIPIVLLYFVRKKELSLSLKGILFLFALFILACGTTHLISVWTIWHPDYLVEAIAKAFTAAVSIGTAVILIPMVPKALALPTAKQLQDANLKLSEQMRERINYEEQLRFAHQELQQRDFERAALSEERDKNLHAILETIVDGIITIDSKGIIKSFNRACESIFGYTPDEVIGKNIKILMPNPYRDEHDGYLRAYEKTGQAKVIGIGREVQGLRKDGHVFPLDLSVSEVKIGNVRSYTGVVRDITERKQFEQDLIQAREVALQASKAKSNFLANMSHEIRTPMNSIIGMIDLLEETHLSVEQHRYANHLRHAGNLLLNLINDVLDLSKIEAGQLSLEKEPFDLIETIEVCAEMLSLRAHEKRLELILYVSKDLEPRWIGDRNRIEQILVNLIGNAIKFTDKGSITIRAELNRDPERKGEVLLSVHDTGIGIPENRTESIFGSFIQVDSSITRKYGGTGLGLSIVKQLTEMKKGKIWVESTEGKGSSFFVSLPLQKAKANQSTLFMSTMNLKSKRVLAVDDNQTNLLVLKEFLDPLGAEFDEANCSEDALEMIRKDEKKYDLLVVDSQMPGMNGLTLIQNFRSLYPENTSTKIVLLSSDARDLQARKDASLGIDGYLQKPMRKIEFLKLLNKVFELHIVELETNDFITEKVANHQPSFDVPPLRILLVDDSENNRSLIRLYLKNSPHTIEEASNGQQALDSYKESKFDLVLMDLQMPVMDGYQATEGIRNFEKQSNREPVPIIALTAHVLGPEAEKCLLMGCNAHIPKPIKKQLLLETIYSYAKHGSDALKTVKPSSPLRVEVDSEIKPLMPDFFKSRNEDLDKLGRAITERDFDTMAKIGHLVKGTAGSYGFMELSELAAHLEEMAKEHNIEEILKVHGRFRTYLATVQIAYK